MRRLTVSLLLLGCTLVAQAAGVRFATGGVGLEERAALEGDRGFNLKVVAAGRDGQYLADVDVTVLDARGTPLVATRTAGPWLMAELPPGRYRIVAAYAGTSQTRDIALSGGREEIIFRWDAAALGGAPLVPGAPIR